jgi:glycosyltransferase involved in cell wall biosynthesis
VLSQKYSALQIIVVNDGSTDSTAEILLPYKNRVEIITQANGGLARARNAGCMAAKGEFIALMDADDICEPDRLAVQLEFMRANPDIGLCSTDFMEFNENGVLSNSGLNTYYSSVAQSPGGLSDIYTEQGTLEYGGHSFVTRKGNVYCHIAQGNFVHPPTVLFRRYLLDQCGLFDESIVNMCDHEWLVRVSRVTSFGYIEAPLLQYRRSEKQMSGLNHYVQAMLDNATVLESVCKNDPELQQNMAETFDKRLYLVYLDAADALSDISGTKSLSLAWRAYKHGNISLRMIKIIFKAVLPRFLIIFFRNRR